jgi:hypothetical protein
MPIFGFANLVCLDLSPWEMATRVTSEQARASLLATRDGAADERWRAATLGGTNFRERGSCSGDVYKSIHASAGVSLDVAPLAGLGFWHDWATMAGEGLIGSAQQAAEHERRCVEELAAQSNARGEPAVIAATNTLGVWPEDFVLSFQRRLVYALGYAASLRAGTMDVYDAWYETAVLGLPAQLGAVGRGSEGIVCFSTALNVLARLDGTMAYERRHGAPHQGAPGTVAHYRAKVTALDGMITSTARGLKAELNADARVALRVLLGQLRSERRDGTCNVLEPPVWGMHVDGRKFAMHEHDR